MVKAMYPHVTVSFESAHPRRWTDRVRSLALSGEKVKYSYLLRCLSNWRIGKSGCAKGDTKGISVSRNTVRLICIKEKSQIDVSLKHICSPFLHLLIWYRSDLYLIRPHWIMAIFFEIRHAELHLPWNRCGKCAQIFNKIYPIDASLVANHNKLHCGTYPTMLLYCTDSCSWKCVEWYRDCYGTSR